MGKKLRAIDLYSGVGGWSLGMSLAGINVVASYDFWGPANETNFKNNRHPAHTVNIRRLSLKDLPKKIDIVVGSPPCTQFSYSNRGGSGDMDDGLEDIVKFFKIVDHLQPHFWAMENVPRVAKVIEEELKPGGRLRKFKHLNISTHILNMEDFGVPQRRIRCIAGNFDMSLLKEYSNKIKPLTLGAVISSLAKSNVTDPIYGIKLKKSSLFDHDEETPLSEEEIRINRAAKMLHPIYNKMNFPDQMDRGVRTITALCTRVSRESIVILSPGPKPILRRLTIRERASLQGFPVTFQFYGTSYSQKSKLIGNAIPPAFTYLIGSAFRGITPDKMIPLKTIASNLTSPVPPPIPTLPETVGSKYLSERTFKFSIPQLHMKSGVRFELSNNIRGTIPSWGVSFWFGTAKDILSLDLNSKTYDRLIAALTRTQRAHINSVLAELSDFVSTADIKNMQALWAHRGPGLTRPFDFLDALDSAGASLKKYFLGHNDLAQQIIEAEIRLR